MKYKIIACDICGKTIPTEDRQYIFKFKRSDFDQDGKFWTKLDMCKTCFEDLKSFVAGNNQLRKDGLPPVVIRNTENE